MSKKIKNLKNEFDAAWKEIINIYFKQFIEYCFPKYYTEINWEHGYKLLDKEFSKINRGAKIGNRSADKLIEIMLNNGQKTVVLVHIEIQASYDVDFEERMLVYHYRIRDFYKKPIASMAILIDANNNWRPGNYKEELWGSRFELQFPIIKITDYKSKILELEASNNPFAQIILVQLAALKINDQEARLISKIALTRHLYAKGWAKDEILKMYKFLDWLIALPNKYELKYNEEVQKIEENLDMPYVSTAERIGIRIGVKQGIQQGESTLLLHLLFHKFKDIPVKYLQKLNNATTKHFLKWSERVLDRSSLEEIFED